MPYDPNNSNWWMEDQRDDQRRQEEQHLRNLQIDEYTRREVESQRMYSPTGLWFLLAGFVLRKLGMIHSNNETRDPILGVSEQYPMGRYGGFPSAERRQEEIEKRKEARRQREAAQK